MEESVDALEQENAQQVVVLDLMGKSDLADHMVFVSGVSPAHLRKMADMLVSALRARKIAGLQPGVEGRHCEDWMIVDAGNIIFQIMDPEFRKQIKLEEHWEQVRPLPARRAPTH